MTSKQDASTTRTRAWTRFGLLLALTLVLGVGLAWTVYMPTHSEAQQRVVASLQATAPAPVAEPTALTHWNDAFTAAAEAVRPAVVFIRAETREEATAQRRSPSPFEDWFDVPDDRSPRRRQGSGSGFIISPDGYIFTNNHVVEGTTKLEVLLFDRREFPAKVVGRDPDTDVAVIKIDAEDLPAVSFGDSDSVRVGEWVLAVGNPLGEQFSFTVTAGIVSAKGRRLGLSRQTQYRIHDFIQTDAAINRGNSGGPLVNARGQVIGINSAIASETGFYQGYGFAIPSSLARTVGQQLISKGKVTRAVLGISIRPIEPEDAAYVGLDSIRGVVVQDFSGRDSPARRAGLEPGDVIVALDGETITSVAQLQQAVRFKTPGEEVRVTVQRQGGEQAKYGVRLMSAPDDNERVASGAARPDPSDGSESYQQKLGINVRELDEAEASRQQLSGENVGLVVTHVDPDGPSEGKLLPQRDPNGTDIITHINNRRVRTLSELNAALARVASGEIVSLRTVLRARSGSLSRVVRIRVGGP